MKKIILLDNPIFNGYRNGKNTTIVTTLFKQALLNYEKQENISKRGDLTVHSYDY